MNRDELAWQLRRFLKGSLSRNELSSWSLAMIMENDNVTPPLPQQEHDFLKEVLEKCALSVEPGQALYPSEVWHLLELLQSNDPYGKVWSESNEGER